ncbi:MAG TPA: DUF222 domain-containing protein [Actinomycetospora sp.]|uniref:HNH endonuclease signature motif containing protein n=1 Tax=Actinomycetospora sp. TaxID=1872135 RepID=UPI002F3EF482
MSRPVVDEAVMRHAQEVMVAARRAEHAVLREVARLEATAAAEVTGYKSTERLVQDLWRVDLGEARRLVRQARALCVQVSPSGSTVEPRLAATAPVSAQGVLDRGHVRVIDEAVRYLERVDGIDPAALGEAEQFLAEKARTLAPRGLARAAAQLISALDPDGVAPEDDAESGDELRMGRRRDGSLVLKGRFRGRADCQLILAAFDALSGRAGAEDDRSLEARYAATLLELCGLALAPGGIGADVAPEDRAHPAETTSPPERGQGDPRHLRREQRHPDDVAREERHEQTLLDDDPGHEDTVPELGDESRGEGEPSGGGRIPPALAGPRAPGRALVMVTMPYLWLRDGIGHGLVGPDEAINPAEARRLACDAGIVPLVLGSRSEPLDVGRLSYAVPEGMRRALVVRDQGCAFSGCTRRPERCHAHHVHHWVDGGETCLENSI